MDNPGSESSSSTESLVDTLSSFFTGESQDESGAQQAQQDNESPEAAAERIAAEEAAAANQNQAAEGEQSQYQQGADADTVTFEVDGKPVQMTKAELAELHKSGLRQKDYTQKTMEVAEQRKAADAEIQKARNERENYAQQLHTFALTSESILAEQQKQLTEDLLRSDPVEYMALERTFRERQANLAKAQQELQRINGERQQEHVEAQANYQREQLEQLQAKLPEWKDPAKARAAADKIKDYLSTEKGLSFSPQEIASLGDHRLIMLADKAMKFDALMKRAQETAGKVAKAPPKVERPGTAKVAPTDGRTSLMKNLNKSGSRDAAAALLGEMFG